jgi:XTP/dITP diphosphohydrolase
MKILVATNNAHKLKEIDRLLGNKGFSILSLKDVDLGHVEIEETGNTFFENSLIKAEGIYNLSKLTCIADDSGLAVECLNGEPGVLSARYSGATGSRDLVDEKNNDKLLQKLAGRKQAVRDENGFVLDKGDCSAEYICVITLYIGPNTAPNISSEPQIFVAKGVCKGVILKARQGTGGFGYDALFLPDGQNKTFAQMSDDEKNAISHRARALADLQTKIREISGKLV